MRMLKRYPLVQAGNTKPAMTTFSDAIVLRDGDATRKEAIGRFVGDIDDDAHASILHHLNCTTFAVAGRSLLPGAKTTSYSTPLS